MVILQKQKNGQYFITIPKVLVEAKKWKKGQVIKIRFNEKGRIELED